MLLFRARLKIRYWLGFSVDPRPDIVPFWRQLILCSRHQIRLNSRWAGRAQASLQCFCSRLRAIEYGARQPGVGQCRIWSATSTARSRTCANASALDPSRLGGAATFRSATLRSCVPLDGSEPDAKVEKTSVERMLHVCLGRSKRRHPDMTCRP